MLLEQGEALHCDVHCLCGGGPWEGDELPTVEFTRQADPTSEQTDCANGTT